MKFSHLILVFLFVVSITGCIKDEPVIPGPKATEKLTPEPESEEPEEPESSVYFRYSGIQRFSGTNIEETSWVVVHDSDGKLLDYKKAEPNVEVVFESIDETVTDKITVTLMNKTIFNENTQNTYLTTRMGVDKESAWALAPSTPRIQTGSFDLYVRNASEWDLFGLSSSDSPVYINGDSDYYYYQYPNLEEDYIQLDDVAIYGSHDFIFSLADKHGKTRYTKVRNAQAGDSISIDAAELMDFDTFGRIDIPEYKSLSFGVRALFSVQGTIQSLSLSSNFYNESSDISLETAELGYIDDFENYGSSINVFTDNFIYSYNKVGSPITSLDIPRTVTFDLKDGSPTNFEFNTNVNYNYQITSFETEEPTSTFSNDTNRTYWNVYSAPDRFKALVTLPEGLMTESEIYLEDIKHTETQIFTKSKSYDEVISSLSNISASQEIIPLETEIFKFRPRHEDSGK